MLQLTWPYIEPILSTNKKEDGFCWIVTRYENQIN